MKHNKKANNQFVTFKKWNSKGYSVFNSLKKTIRIGVLLAVYLRFANHNEVFAQETPDSSYQHIDLEEIDITSDEYAETYSALSRVVAVIRKHEIEQAPVSSVNELLEYASNIDIRQRGANGIQADISIRGGTFDQALVLLNGINISDPQTGHHHLNIPIDLSSIERVEILKGPGAWKFGPGAFSGAINIITGVSEKNYIEAGAEVGQYAYSKEKVNAGFNAGRTAHFVSGMYSSTAGYTANTDNNQLNVYYTGSIKGKRGTTSIQAGYSDKSFGANSFYTAKYPNQYEELQTHFASASHNLKLKQLRIEPRLYFQRSNDRFLLFRDNPGLYSNYHTSDVFGFNSIASYFHAKGAVTLVGIESRTESIYSNSLGEITTDPIASPVNDTIILNRFHSRTNLSAFFGHKRFFNNFMINAGINVTYNTDIEKKLFVFPGIDMSYTINNRIAVFASANKTMRMPTYTDLYYQGPNNIGNPDLLPEEATGYEMGLKHSSDIFKGKITLFYMHSNNLIDWVKAKTDDPWETVNYAIINTSGAEVSASTNFLKLIPGQTILQGLTIQYTFIDQQKAEKKLISHYTLNYLRHRIDASIRHAIIRNVYVTWHIAYQNRNGQYEKFVDGKSAGLVGYSPFFTTDLKVYWKYKGWQLSGRINNIFDVKYYDIGNVPQPGRWIRFGFSKKFSFKPFN
ncbi:MAG: TonB-dependent receptor [Prolixibacteraceae bacterium]|nr:TonB-dependent receptor [Prolixibacteraceae bacterium]